MSFKRKLLIVFLSLMTFTVSFIIFLKVLENQRSITRSESKGYHFHLLIHELKQNFNDLTRMARAYVATGEPHYRDYFQKILDIRDGKIPRPKNYHNPYWDFVSATGRKPQKDGQPVAFWTLVEKAGFTDGDMETLKKAEDLFEKFLNLIKKAVYAMDGLYRDEKGDYTLKRPSNKNMAVELLYSGEYEGIRKKFMDFLENFSGSINEGIDRDIFRIQSKNKRLMAFLWVTVILAFLLIIVFIFLPIEKKTET